MHIARTVMRFNVSVVFLAAAVAAPGYAYDVDWYTIDGGGEMFTAGGDFELSGTIGQPDAGEVMTGGNFELTGGFWPGAFEFCLGDIDGDGVTDAQDLTLLLAAWFSKPGDPNWDPRADLDNNNVIDAQDLTLLLADWFCGK